MKKRIILFALILCLALTAVACKKDDEPKGTDAPTTTEAPTGETTTETPTTEEPTDEVLPGGMEVVTGDTGKFGGEILPDQKK